MESCEPLFAAMRPSVVEPEGNGSSSVSPIGVGFADSLDADEVPAWVRSLQLRGIEFPETLRPELYLIVGENRDYHAIVGRHEPSPAA
mgnify:CR=1 FL=1